MSWIDEAVAAGARKAEACKIAMITIRTLQRWCDGDHVSGDKRPDVVRKSPSNTLSTEERQRIIDTCNQKEFASLPPSQIVPTLADRGIYLGSEATIYRVLKQAGQLHHRGKEKPKGSSPRPTCHVATAPNALWSWDISYLPTRVIGQHYYLYMIEDIYSRKIVGAEVYERETGELASELFQRAVWAERCSNTGLVLHSDNGSPMKCLTMQAKMCELGVAGSRSRPGVSNDNAFSESLFKTLKYCPRYPSEGFESLEKARQWVAQFVHWYNEEHRHSRINFVTPAQRHRGEDALILEKRKALYESMRAKTPERWSGDTRNWSVSGAVSLNPQKNQEEAA